MSDRMQIGEASLKYLNDLNEILNILASGVQAGEKAREAVLNGIYEGGAKEELVKFYVNYFKKACNLYSYYSRCVEYISYAMEQMKYTDEEIARIVINVIAEKG